MLRQAVEFGVCWHRGAVPLATTLYLETGRFWALMIQDIAVTDREPEQTAHLTVWQGAGGVGNPFKDIKNDLASVSSNV